MAMHSTIKRSFSILGLVCLVLLATLPPAVQTASAYSPPESQLRPDDSSRLYRTSVTLSQPSSRKRLGELGIGVLEEGNEQAVVLVDQKQLATLARLRFQPHATDEVYGLLTGTPIDKVRAAAAQPAGISGLPSLDDDGDGLTNTQEQWWCTNQIIPDSDGDGVSDGAEVQALKDWLGNRRSGPPASGTPFLGWPMVVGDGNFNSSCIDHDHDAVPDLAEQWDLGLNANRESTDRDKFDDGQELFGITRWAWGALPRAEDAGIIFAEMPSWVKAPGNHPLVAAFPTPQIDVVPSSLHVQTVTTVTTDHTIGSGTEKAYSTAKTEGTSTSVANTTTWNDWQEVSVTTPQDQSLAHISSISSQRIMSKSNQSKNEFTGIGGLHGNATVQGCASGAASGNLVGASASTAGCANINSTVNGDVSFNLISIDLGGLCFFCKKPDEAQTKKVNTCTSNCPVKGAKIADDNQKLNYQSKTSNTQDRLGTGNDTEYITDNSSIDQSTHVDGRQYYQITYPAPRQLPTRTASQGHSWGGAQTTTTEQYEEHTVTNGEAFSNSESWGNATAVDAAHSADLWFTYKVRNAGAEYAREIGNLAFNVYIGDDPNPAATYFVAPDLGGDGKFHNFMPGEEHGYTSHRISLTLDQMKAIDVDPSCAMLKQTGQLPSQQACPGGQIRIVAEDFTYGVDELFYQEAAGAGVLVAMEDGTNDGDEQIDSYIIPTWGDGDTAQDVIGRYFPFETDATGNIVAISTPENRTDTPSWCEAPRHTGGTLWCQHALSTADWWNIYLNNLGDGTAALKDTPAVAGSTALFRFNQDADLDGYSDRSEMSLGTDPLNPASHPKPELLAGVNSIRSGSNVTATLSLLNTGVYDAYGVEAVMIAPDDSVSITNNTVGGSGRVRAQKQVIVGSRILSPAYTSAAWRGTAKPASGGYYTGNQDITYSFKVTCGNSGGCDVGAGNWSLRWSNNVGANGVLDFDAGYASPKLLDVGTFGVKLSLLSGKVYNNDTFTVEADTPRDTFQYTINRVPYTQPVVLVSYNDPQGNHRFITPVSLGTPTDNLAGYSGQMIQNPGVEIVATDSYKIGANTTNLVVNNPTGATLSNSHLFLEFIDSAGAVVSEMPVTTTLPAGPTVVPVQWNTDSFSPAFQTGEDYIVMAFWTDYQGNILDTAGRPLSSFQADPKPNFAMTATDSTWDFGTAKQGTLLNRAFSFANTGYLDLRTYISAPPSVTISQTGSRSVGPSDLTTYNIAVNTTGAAEGPYDQTITIRTTDPDNPTRTVHIIGTIVASTSDNPQGDILRPLDWDAHILGDHNAHEWVDFTHTLGPDTTGLHPVKIYSQDYGTLWGVGQYATPFDSSTASYDMFGDGKDSDLTVNPGETRYTDDVRTRLANSASAGANTLCVNSTSGLAIHDEVLVIQSQGSGVGNYEFGTITGINGCSLTLQNSLHYSYTTPNSVAQVLRVPHYHNVTIQGGGTLTAHTWDGSTGGVLALRANGMVVVNGVVTATGLGFRGGRSGGSYGVNAYGQQGEGLASLGGQSAATNSILGGGAGSVRDRGEGGNGGGGGGQATNGVDGGWDGWPTHGGQVGQGGMTYGIPDLTTILFGGAGGGGGHGDTAWQPWSGAGGNGGGIVMLFGGNISVSGSVTANGVNGQTSEADQAGGGGGAGGAILIKAQNATLGSNLVTANAGSGGSRTGSGNGGSGGLGRIRVEYCDTRSGLTTPLASDQKLNCYIAEQGTSGPNQTRLNLPESFSGDHIYKVQYGRRLTFGGADEQITTLRIPAGAFSTATLDTLVSNTSAGSLTMRLDIGNNGDWDCEQSSNINNAVTLLCNNLASAFNAYWSSHGTPSSGDVDVPVRVSLSKAGQLLLTNLQMVPNGSTVRYIRLAAHQYSNIALDTSIGDNGSSPYTIAADVGDDGIVDWTQSGSASYPMRLTTGNLATAANAYLVGRSGEVDVPIRFYIAPFLPLKTNSISATTITRADVALVGMTPPISAPTEGDATNVAATLSNAGSLDSGPLTASFFATPPGQRETYIGSVLVPNIPAGNTAQANILWNTLGFIGTIPVRVVADPFNRLAESNENNNTTSANFTIRTKPDLRPNTITLSNDEPVVGEAVSVLVPMRNTGQTSAGAQTVALFQGLPDVGGVTLGSNTVTALLGGADTTVSFTWTPTQTGLIRLFARVDNDRQINESDKSNNDIWRDVYVGFPSPIDLDSGNTSADQTYNTSSGYGVIDTGQPDALGACGTKPEQTFRRDPSGSVQYQFDHLQTGHFYHLDLTLYECGQSAGRQEYVNIDGNRVAGPVDLGDDQVHSLSILLDPAVYADHTIRIAVEAHEGLGALVNQITLHDVDYRYADAGGSNDTRYPGNRGYGWLDGSPTQTWGSLPFQSARVDQDNNDIRYQFDRLNPYKHYQIRTSFYQGSGQSRVQQLRIDGQSIDKELTIFSGKAYSETVTVPLSTYATDGTIVVNIARTNSSVGAMLNEIVLEEVTMSPPPECIPIAPTPTWSAVYGNVTIKGQPAQKDAIITAENVRGDIVGCFKVTATGQYGLMTIYGEDPTANPAIAGMRDGETIIFRVDGARAVPTPSLEWHDDKAAHEINLEAGTVEAQLIPLSPGWNLASWRVEPPAPQVEIVLSSITGNSPKYCRVLSESGIYDCAVPERFHTLKALPGGQAYYLRLEDTVNANALVEGVPITLNRPIALHIGWNWVGYLPSATMPITLALKSIEGQYLRVADGHGQIYDPALPAFSTLKQMKPGDGYLIYAKSIATLIYPDSTATSQIVTSKGLAVDTPVDNCKQAKPTPLFTWLYGSLMVNGAPAPIGTRVQILTPRGSLAGCYVVNQVGQYGFLPIFGRDSDSYTPGFGDGEALTMRINGLVAPLPKNLLWSDDKTPHRVDLQVKLSQLLYLPVVAR